jgi:hypothetical protein
MFLEVTSRKSITGAREGRQRGTRQSCSSLRTATAILVPCRWQSWRNRKRRVRNAGRRVPSARSAAPHAGSAAVVRREHRYYGVLRPPDSRGPSTSTLPSLAGLSSPAYIACIAKCASRQSWFDSSFHPIWSCFVALPCALCPGIKTAI